MDTVLTTNDIIAMFAERHIDPRDVKPVPVDAFFGKVSGAGIIFGASGGVAEAALRLAAERVTGRRLESFSYEGVRGLKGVKETNVTLGDAEVRLAVVSGLQNAQLLIDRIRSGDAPYDLIEVMACPGGCINGSGNPAPQLVGETGQRLEVLYRLDEEAPIRKSQDNPSVQAIYGNWLGEPDSETSHHALHTTYGRRSMRLEEPGEERLLEGAAGDRCRRLHRHALLRQGFLEAPGGAGGRASPPGPLRPVPGQGALLHRPVRRGAQRGRRENDHRQCGHLRCRRLHRYPSGAAHRCGRDSREASTCSS